MSKRAHSELSRIGRIFDWIGARTIAGLSWLLQRIPERAGIWLAPLIAAVWYRVDRRHRRVAEENLRLAYGPALSDAECRRIVRAVFHNAASNAVEFLTMPRWSAATLPSFCDLRGQEQVRKAVADGTGVILLTAHLGNWELMAVSAGFLGIPLSAVARPLDQPAINAAVTALREFSGVRLIQRRAGALAALRTLRKGLALGILADQNTRRDQVFVEFFGRPAATTPAPAYLALKTGAAVLPCYFIRIGPRRFRFRVEPPIPPVQTGNFEQDVLLTTQRYTTALERVVRRHPENWFWIHRRWKTQPPDDWTPPRVPEEATVPAG